MNISATLAHRGQVLQAHSGTAKAAVGMYRNSCQADAVNFQYSDQNVVVVNNI